jgi:hypothetical protein
MHILYQVPTSNLAAVGQKNSSLGGAEKRINSCAGRLIIDD